jgi:glycosyltransferase involved in cell wall biosynthesis
MVNNKEQKISIIIPAYNEEVRISETVHELINYFFPHEILVVMDGCTDRTPEIVADLSTKYQAIISVLHPTRLGKGGGILLGISKATGDVLVILDADGAVPPEDVGKMVGLISADIDCTISSRYLPGSVIHTPQPFHRVLASRGFNAMIRLLFSLPFKDTQCGCKVLKAQVAQEVADQIQTHNYAFDVELLWLIKQHGYTIEEVPVHWHHKEGSKVDLKKVIPQMFAAVIKLRF